MLKFKSILSVAGAGFVFSFLTGLLSGNHFSVIILRAFTGSVLFTVIIAAAVFVLKKALPELDDLFNNKSEEFSEEKNKGSGIDIIIEDEQPYSPADYEKSDNENMDEDKLLHKDFIEEVEEESIDDIGILKEAVESDDPEEVIEVMDDSMNSSALPELDPNVSFLSGGSDSTAGADNDAIDKLGGNVDAGTMAKAIKTILKKDQKG